jgi:hypothetical protein
VERSRWKNSIHVVEVERRAVRTLKDGLSGVTVSAHKS